MIEKKSRDIKPCIFPFKFSGQTFTQCTTVKDPDDKPWCSTKVNENGNHVTSGGYWGHCGQDCDEDQPEVQKAELAIDEGYHLVQQEFIGSNRGRGSKF